MSFATCIASSFLFPFLVITGALAIIVWRGIPNGKDLDKQK